MERSNQPRVGRSPSDQGAEASPDTGLVGLSPCTHLRASVAPRQTRRLRSDTQAHRGRNLTFHHTALALHPHPRISGRRCSCVSSLKRTPDSSTHSARSHGERAWWHGGPAPWDGRKAAWEGWGQGEEEEAVRCVTWLALSSAQPSAAAAPTPPTCRGEAPDPCRSPKAVSGPRHCI